MTAMREYKTLKLKSRLKVEGTLVCHTCLNNSRHGKYPVSLLATDKFSKSFLGRECHKLCEKLAIWYTCVYRIVLALGFHKPTIVFLTLVL